MSKKEFLKRYLLLLMGLFIMAFGVALSTRANLGISPVSSVPYVLSLELPWTMGQITIAMHVVFIMIQMILLRKDFEKIQFLQLALAIVFGFFTDFSLSLVSILGLSAENYFSQWLLCFISFAVIAFGVYLEVNANVVMLAGEGLMLAITKVFHKEFGKVKIGFDCTQLIVAVVISFTYFHSLKGIREGTIAAAMLVGTIVRFYSRKLTYINKLLTYGGAGTNEANDAEHNHQKKPDFVITIDGEFGSGGYKIGQLISDKLGIEFYDKELIELEAKESGLTTEYIQKNEGKFTNSLLYDLYMQTCTYMKDEKQKVDELFLIQSKVIKDLSAKKSCVIVGLLGNYILREYKNCFHIFIHADKEYRVERVMQEKLLGRDAAVKECKKIDTERKNHFKHYPSEAWGMAENYHLTINNTPYGDEETANLIINACHRLAVLN